jgi:hypothetical protein
MVKMMQSINLNIGNISLMSNKEYEVCSPGVINMKTAIDISDTTAPNKNLRVPDSLLLYWEIVFSKKSFAFWLSPSQ